MIIKRKGAIGDCLMITPAIREYKYRNPDAFFGIETDCSHVFCNNPFVDIAGPRISRQHSAGEDIVDLNGIYERNFNRHPVDVYAQAILGDLNFHGGKELCLFLLLQGEYDGYGGEVALDAAGDIGAGGFIVLHAEDGDIGGIGLDKGKGFLVAGGLADNLKIVLAGEDEVYPFPEENLWI